MSTGKTYEVVLRRRLPYVSRAFRILSVLCPVVFIAILFFSDLVDTFRPHAASLSSFCFYTFVISLAGSIVFGILSFHVRRRIPAVLGFQHYGFSITSQKEDIYVSYTHITKIICNDLETWRGVSRQQFQVVLRQKGGKATSFRLADYSQADELVGDLSQLKDIPFSFYERAFEEDDESVYPP